MADLSRLVATNFEANTSKFSGPVSSMAGVAGGAGMAIGRLTAMLAPLAAGIGMIGTLKGIAELGAAAEDNQIKIAGFLTAIGKTGNFDQGLKVAAQTIRMISVRSAVLPGQAQEYIDVFQKGMVVVDSAVHGTTEDILNFTNKYTAVSKMMGVSAQGAGIALVKMLQSGHGMASSRMPAWQAMLGIAKRLPGYADLTADKFNKMTPEKRVKAMKDIMASMQPMLDATANTWTARIGTMRSIMKMMVKESTHGLYDTMKTWLGAFNDLFMDSKGHWTQFGESIIRTGKLISEHIGKAMGYVGRMVESAVYRFRTLNSDIRASPIFKIFDKAATRVAGGLAESTKHGGGIAGMAVKGAAAAGGAGPAGALLVGGIVNALSRPGALEGAFTKVAKIVDMASTMFAPFLRYLDAITNVIGDALSNVIPPFVDAVMSIVSPLITMMGALYEVGRSIITQVRPAFFELTTKVGALYKTVATAVHPAMRLLGAGMTWLFTKIATHGIPILISFLHALGSIIKVIIWAISRIAKVINFVADKILGPEKAGGKTGDEGGVLFDFMKALEGGGVEKIKAHSGVSTPDARPTAETYQDFRGSKFDVVQKFAEGFDPDRVAIALASDLGRIGEQKLQSGYEPAFGIR